MDTIEKIEALINKEPSNRVKEMDELFKKIEKLTIDREQKPSYTLPPKDTIGRNIYSLITHR